MPLELNGASAEVTAPILAALRGAGSTVTNTFEARQTFGGIALAGLTLADAATIEWDLALGSMAAVEIAGARTLQMLNLAPGTYRLRVTQGAGGSHTLAFDAGLTVRTPGGVALGLSAAAGAVDWLEIRYFTGTTVDVTVQEDFQEP
jgi:hypothetical protein